MKKYEVPVMKLHQLKTEHLLLEGSNGSKENFDRSAANTESYDVEESFNSKNYFDN